MLIYRWRHVFVYLINFYNLSLAACLINFYSSVASLWAKRGTTVITPFASPPVPFSYLSLHKFLIIQRDQGIPLAHFAVLDNSLLQSCVW